MSASRAPLRLRSTCDACSAAKVKCDKKQPACDRCRTNSFRCSYSPSRRHGKHAWKGFSELDLTAIGMTAAPEPVMDVDSGNGQGGGGGDDDATNVDFNALGDGFEDYSHWTGLNLGTDLPMGFGTSDDAQVHGIPRTDPNSIPQSISSSIWNTQFSVPSSISEVPQSRTTSYDCEAEAFTALHSLHACTMLHRDRPGELTQTTTGRSTSFGEVTDRMPPLDKVLYFNRAAISTVKELLDSPGVQQPHLALLYMTIASKVLFWYRLVVSSQYESKSGPRSPSSSDNSINTSNGQPSPLSTDSNTTDRAVKSVSIQIGVFDLEDEDQKLLMRGVLLREVRKLEGVVDKMKMLGDKYTRDNECDDEQQESNWYGIASSKLQGEVRDTLRQIKEFGAGSARRD